MSFQLNKPLVIAPDDLRAEYAEAVLDTCVVAEADVSVIELKGSGAVTCAQGLITNDIDDPGDGAVLYAAFLTNKGMIISDAWVTRDGETVSLIVPSRTGSSVGALLERSVPPRLAQVKDISAETTVLRLVGPRSLEVASRAGLHVPDPGRSVWCLLGSIKCFVSRPTEPSPFSLQINSVTRDAQQIRDSLLGTGGDPGPDTALELARILAGWPSVGNEIGEKTLPQEVRFDEHNGISYTKGCYTGQETVARLHFRGHANRGLIGLTWEGQPNLGDDGIVQDEKQIGRVCSMAWLDPIDQYIGIGSVRLSADISQPVIAAGEEANITELPFHFDW